MATVFIPHLSVLVNKYKDYVTNGADVEKVSRCYQLGEGRTRESPNSEVWPFFKIIIQLHFVRRHEEQRNHGLTTYYVTVR